MKDLVRRISVSNAEEQETMARRRHGRHKGSVVLESFNLTLDLVVFVGVFDGGVNVGPDDVE